MFRSFICKLKQFRPSFSPGATPYVYGNNMKVFVKKSSEEDRMEIALTYVLPNGLERTFNFNRLVTEEVGVAVDRMAENIRKQANKGLKKRQKKAKNLDELPKEEEISVKILKSGFELPRSLCLNEAFTDDTSLLINDTAYQICVNVPKITLLSLPDNIMVGFEYFPAVAMEYGEKRSSVFEWYHEDENKEAVAAAEAEVPQTNWMLIHTGFTFTPQTIHIGKKLKIKCTPKNSIKAGEAVEAVSTCEVTASPGFCPYMTRHQFTKERANGIRVVSYNLLADFYADSDFSREHLFPYCPPYVLNIDYRKPIFTSEILGYNADLVCLQECDVKVFNDQLLPILDVHGLEGVMKRKGHTAEGTAVFYARDKFDLVETHDIQVSDHLKESAGLKPLYEKICEKEELRERVMNRQTSLQVVLLECKEDSTPTRRILVANTHLFWHPTGAHIRLLQTVTCLDFIEELLKKYSVDGTQPTVIFAGDFNTVPLCGNSKFLAEGALGAGHVDWMRGGETEYVGGFDVKHSINLTSACGYPEFTNYTAGFKECLDYIFVTPDLEVEQVVPLPSEEELSLHIAIPNVVFPSDHLALVCDLKWK